MLALKPPESERDLLKALRDMGWSASDIEAEASNKVPELQARWVQAKSAIRANRLWWVALISAVASVLSATVALIALLMNLE